VDNRGAHWQDGEPGHGRLRYDGDLDLASSVTLLQAVRVQLRTRPQTLALDLSGVAFIDVAGLRAVISCRRMAAARGIQLQVVEVSPPVRRLLELVGLSSAFGLDGARGAEGASGADEVDGADAVDGEARPAAAG
jgi:anti-anti-sigma factor